MKKTIKPCWPSFQSVPVGVRDALEANIQDLYINKFWGMKYATAAACTVLKVDQVSSRPSFVWTSVNTLYYILLSVLGSSPLCANVSRPSQTVYVHVQNMYLLK